MPRLYRTLLTTSLILITACNNPDEEGSNSGSGSGDSGETATTAPPPPDGPFCDGDGECEPGEYSCGDCSLCGDGNKDPGEQCDDHNQDNSDDCVDNCQVARCGDRHVQSGVEQCDDGTDNVDSAEYQPVPRCYECNLTPSCGDGVCDENDRDGCFKDCETEGPACANMVVEPGEVCDQANDMAYCNGSATPDEVRCRASLCGDGYMNAAAGEECDDGNDKDDDDCVSKCKLATIGDRLLNTKGLVTSKEQCDDGNNSNDDECDDTGLQIRRVFVTKSAFTGSLGGLDGADELCNLAAARAHLGRTFRAWLSDSTGSPATRFDTTFTGTYRLLRKGGMNAKVADGWVGLTSGSLLQAIERDEFGEPSTSNVWTNTKTDGTAQSDKNCNNWTGTSDVASTGNANQVNELWTHVLDAQDCLTEFSLYCIEDVFPQ